MPVGAYGTPFDDPGTSLHDRRLMVELRFEPHLGDKVELLTRVHADHYESFEQFAPAGDGYTEDYAGTWFGGEARVVVTPRPWLRLTGGFEGQIHPQATMIGDQLMGGKPFETYLNEHDPYQFGAGYALVEASPLPWLRLSGGARVDVYSTFGADRRAAGGGDLQADGGGRAQAHGRPGASGRRASTSSSTTTAA